MARAIPSSLTEFWAFAKDFESVMAWVAKAAVVAPLVGIALKIGPPWPSRVSVAVLMCMSEIIVLMYSFEFWKRGSPRVRHIRSVMGLAIGGCAMCLVVYLFLLASFIVDAFDNRHQVVIGYDMHNDVAEMVEDNPSKWTPEELIRQFHDVQAVWTQWSVNVMRTVVLTVWLLMWVLLAIIIAAFSALQWRRLA